MKALQQYFIKIQTLTLLAIHLSPRMYAVSLKDMLKITQTVMIVIHALWMVVLIQKVVLQDAIISRKRIVIIKKKKRKSVDSYDKK